MHGIVTKFKKITSRYIKKAKITSISGLKDINFSS